MIAAGLLRVRRAAERAGLTALLRSAVLGVAAPVLCWPFTTPAGALAASCAAFAGALAADLGSRSGRICERVRLPSALLLALLLALLGALLSRVFVQTSLASWLGASTAVAAAEALFWGAVLGAGAFALRLSARRHSTAALLEALAVAGAFALGLAAHRNGMVHRPLAIGDWAWSRGLDPTLVFLVLGGACVLLLAALLVTEERRERLPLHFAGLLAVGALLFLFVRVSGLPQARVPMDLGLTGAPEAQAQRDPSSDLELRDLPFRDEYSASGQQAPVAVVLLRDDYSPPSGVYYFRQSVFSQYNGRRLVQATRDDVDRDVVHTFPSAVFEVPGPPESPHRRPLDTTVGLLVDHVRPFALDSPIVIQPRSNPNPLRFQRTFDARSLVRTLPYDEMLGLEPGAGEWQADQWEHYTEAPSDPRYQELAHRVTSVLQDEYRSDPLARALAVKFYLDEHGIYSRKSRHADQPDPAASFLFGDLTGYCVHFAHASTYLLRSLGVPARVAAGYAVPENVRAGGSAILIQGLNAHAWPEIYLEGAGWVVVDLAPEQVLDQLAPQPDPSLQQLLADLLRGGKTLEEYQSAQAQSSFAWDAIARALAALLAALVVLSAAAKVYRRLAPRLAGPADMHRLVYRSALDRLAEVGFTRGFGESRERFGERAAALAPSFPSLTGEHLRAALGPGARRGPDDLRGLLGSICPELVGHVPGWRRWLGLLNPFSWWSSR